MLFGKSLILPFMEKLIDDKETAIRFQKNIQRNP